MTSTNPRLLAFRLPTRKSVDEPIPPPPPNASFGDKLQWLAAHRPHTLEPLAEAVESVLQTHRHQSKIYIPPRRPAPKFSPAPALTIELCGELRYRSVRVFDHDCLLAPAENRIGRFFAELMPADLTQKFLRALDRARRLRRPSSYTYAINGKPWKGCVIAPSEDTVIVTVSRLLACLPLACV